MPHVPKFGDTSKHWSIKASPRQPVEKEPVQYNTPKESQEVTGAEVGTVGKKRQEKHEGRGVSTKNHRCVYMPFSPNEKLQVCSDPQNGSQTN
jgi:hypothetical protein